MLTDELLAPVFALAEARNVPILIHGGRGLPPIADDLARLVERYPDSQLIVAHAGIADMAGLAGHLGGKAGVFFDTSVWSPLDLLDLYRLVAPEQVVYASDYPYGSQPSSLLLTLRTAKLARLLRRAAAGALRAGTRGGSSPVRPRSSRRARSAPTASRSRSRSRGSTSTSRWRRRCCGRASPTRSACSASRSTRPRSATGTATETEQIRELLMAARDLWRAMPDLDDDAEVIQTGRAAFRLIHVADILAVTAGT